MNNLIPIHDLACEIVLSYPNTFAEAAIDAQALKKGQLLLVSLGNLPYESAQRITDFLAGSTHSLMGQVREIGNGVYLFAPPSISILTFTRKSGHSRRVDNLGECLHDTKTPSNLYYRTEG
ncbi:cell division protein SepF [Acaryochloris sp. CCMEE 5410]|uniref:cell division protein SepF n=1 Tax=Acaryochloris sp. CCMEE 5410 TaxID=310037 RepID=UPI000681D75D|nr:cell division protein SepF [Acaryochloris sp. CCMEE 5410]KAI9132468.1 cell division protein SepF [Acaryochloris sp. CCMEE 5410]